VIAVRWRTLDSSMAGPSSSVPVRGFGQYVYGGDFALEQRMNLMLRVGKDDPARFDSGLAPGGDSFPSIDTRVSIAGARCFDTVIDIHAEPRGMPIQRSTHADGDR